MTYSAMQMAEAFIRAGELNDAAEALTAHLEANSADDDARRLRAAVRLRLGGEVDLRGALDDLSHLSRPDADDYVQRSVVLQAMSDWTGANTAMEVARSLRPDDERMAERHTETLRMSGQLPAARALVATMPQTWRWQQLAGDLAVQAGDRADAATHYRAALEHLEARMDTQYNAFAVNLKAVLEMKLAGLDKG